MVASTTPGDTGDPLLRAVVVERHSPVPLYYQVAHQLEHAITSEQIPAGTRLDNEIQLAERLGLSRPTMRRAIEYLVDKGLVVRRRGVGTRVVQSRVRRPLQLTSLYDDLVSTGQKPTTTVLSIAVEPASAEIAQELRVDPDTPVQRIVRLRSTHGRPLARLTNVLPADLFSFTKSDLESTGLYQLVRLAGVHLHSATQTIGARMATAAEAQLLDERRGSAVLTMERTAYDDSGRAVEYGTHIYAASRYTFEVHLLSP